MICQACNLPRIQRSRREGETSGRDSTLLLGNARLRLVKVAFVVVLTMVSFPGQLHAVPFVTDCLPPLDSQYISQFNQHGEFPGSFVIRNAIHSQFSSCLPPPGPGGSTTHTFGSMVTFEVSPNGGMTFFPQQAPATVTVRVDFSSQSGATRFFNTEMLQLDISGGTLPSNILLRESPSLPSPGQTTITTIPGGFDITSVFNLQLELSTNGGETWVPQLDGPITVILVAAPEPSTLFLLGFGLISLAALGRQRLFKRM